MQTLINILITDIFLLTTFLPMWYSFLEGKTDIDDLITKEDYRKNLYTNKRYIAELEQLLPKYLYNGYLEN